MNQAKEWIEKLPCGLKVDLLKNECCKTICPEKRKTCEEIENCEYWKAKEGLA